MADDLPADALLDEPIYSAHGGPIDSTETPFDKAYNLLSSTEGELLEIMTRTTPRIVDAANVGFTMCSAFHSNYIKGRVDMLMRFAVSMDGKGRGEIVQSLAAGSGVPGEYYENNGGNKKMAYSETDD